MKKRIFLSIIFLILSVLVFKMSIAKSETSTVQEKTPSVKTTTLPLRTVQESVDFSGFVQGINETHITPALSGSVIKLTKEEGDRVSKGEVLAIIDGKEFTNNTQSAEASLRSLSETIKTTEKYYNQKVDEAKTAFENGEGTEESWKSAKRLREAQMAVLENQKTALVGTLSSSEIMASRTLVKAPFSGIITEKSTDIGSYVIPGTTLYILASAQDFEVTVSIPLSLSTHIEKNSKVILQDGTKTIDGFVFSIAPLVEENGGQSLVRVRFPLGSDISNLALGEYVQVSFLIGSKHEAILAPEQSLISQYDDTFMYIVQDEKIEKKTVLLGKMYDGQREILSGIDPSWHIVLAGGYNLIPHQKVTEIYEAQ